MFCSLIIFFFFGLLYYCLVIKLNFVIISVSSNIHTYQTFTLHTAISPALSCRIGDAGDVLVPTSSLIFTLRAASPVTSRHGAITCHPLTGCPAHLAGASVAAVSPQRPVLMLTGLQNTGCGAVLGGAGAGVRA